MNLGRLAPIAFLLALAALPAPAQERHPVIVFKDGRTMSVQGWESKGQLTYITDLGGTVAVVKTELIDFDKTKRATAAALRPPTPTPTPRKEKSLVELSREIQEKRRRAIEIEPGIPSTRPATPPPLATPTVAAVTPPPALPSPAAATPPPEATPAPTQVAAVVPPTTPGAGAAASASPGPGVEGRASAPLPGGTSPVVLYGGIGLGLVVIGGGVALALRRRRPIAAEEEVVVAKMAAPRAARPAGAAAGSEELLHPAFASDSPAEDLPAPVFADESLASPAELAGATGDTKALTDGRKSLPLPTVLEDGREVQIRIQSDVYTCPDLATLKRWVEEGRVIENSEILSPDGTWLLAGSIPDLEPAFEKRREVLGY